MPKRSSLLRNIMMAPKPNTRASPYADTSLYLLLPEAEKEAKVMLSDILPTALSAEF